MAALGEEHPVAGGPAQAEGDICPHSRRRGARRGRRLPVSTSVEIASVSSSKTRATTASMIASRSGKWA